MNLLQRLIGHFKTITRHRHQVIRHCAKAGILWQGLRHDLSKYSPTEFLPGVRYYNGQHSPTEDERRAEGCSRAWMHHKGRNRHHWEYWTDIHLAEKCYKSVPMPKRYLAEMICDRMAASKIYKGQDYTNASPLEYLQHGKTRQAMHPETYAQLEQFLTVLRDDGEEEMFRRLRAWLKA